MLTKPPVLVGAFSVITNLRMELFEALAPGGSLVCLQVVAVGGVVGLLGLGAEPGVPPAPSYLRLLPRLLPAQEVSLERIWVWWSPRRVKGECKGLTKTC